MRKRGLFKNTLFIHANKQAKHAVFCAPPLAVQLGVVSTTTFKEKVEPSQNPHSTKRWDPLNRNHSQTVPWNVLNKSALILNTLWDSMPLNAEEFHSFKFVQIAGGRALLRSFLYTESPHT